MNTMEQILPATGAIKTSNYSSLPSSPNFPSFPSYTGGFIILIRTLTHSWSLLPSGSKTLAWYRRSQILYIRVILIIRITRIFFLFNRNTRVYTSEVFFSCVFYKSVLSRSGHDGCDSLLIDTPSCPTLSSPSNHLWSTYQDSELKGRGWSHRAGDGVQGALLINTEAPTQSRWNPGI